MSRLRNASIIILVVAAVGLSACGRDQPPEIGTTIIEISDRQPLPEVSGTTLDGAALSLSDLRGRVVVLNSWASWCEPCRTEVPAFVRLAEAVDPANVVVVGLDVSDAPDAAQAFVDDLDMPYPSIVDGAGSILRTIPGVPPAALPSTVIIDREGRIAVRIIGEVQSTTLPGLVAQVAAER